MFPVCNEMLGSIYISSLLVYVLSLEELNPLMILKNNDFWFQLFFVVSGGICLCGSLLLGLL